MTSPFPLRLTPLEEFFVLDDQPGYPNQMICHLTLDGKLDRDTWDQAVEVWSHRHLMFMAKVVGKTGKGQWVLPKYEHDKCVWYERTEAGLPAFPRLDVHTGPGAKIIVVRRPDHDEIVLQTHHANTDGVGGMRAIQELLMMYDNMMSPTEPLRHKIRTLDNERLRVRNRFPRTLWQRVKSIPAAMIGVFGAVKYFSRRAVPLAKQSSIRTIAASETDYAPTVITHSFSNEESEQLRQMAGEANVTVNGLLIRDLFLAVRDWQDHHNCSRNGKCLRVMVPINLRSMADRRLGAGNRVSMVYLDRNDKQMRRPEELLWGVNFEIKTVQRLKLPLFSLTCLRIISWIPGLLTRQTASTKCRATTILTNLGEPFGKTNFERDELGHVIVGGRSIVNIDLAAPLRPLTHAAVSVFRYAKRTHVSLHYDSSSLGRGQAEGLMRRYHNHVSKTLHKAEKQKANVQSDLVETSTRGSLSE